MADWIAVSVSISTFILCVEKWIECLECSHKWGQILTKFWLSRRPTSLPAERRVEVELMMKEEGRDCMFWLESVLVGVMGEIWVVEELEGGAEERWESEASLGMCAMSPARVLLLWEGEVEVEWGRGEVKIAGRGRESGERSRLQTLAGGRARKRTAASLPTPGPNFISINEC